VAAIPDHKQDQLPFDWSLYMPFVDDEEVVTTKPLNIASTSHSDLETDDTAVEFGDTNALSRAGLERLVPSDKSSYVRFALLTDTSDAANSRSNISSSTGICLWCASVAASTSIALTWTLSSKKINTRRLSFSSYTLGMPRKTDGSGTIYQRGDIWWVKIYVNGQPKYESSKSTKKTDAVKLRDRLLAKKHRGEITGGAPDKVLIGELLDDVLKSDIKQSTRYVWEKVVEKNLRPAFGTIRAARLSTDLMDRYREKRTGEGRTDATVNRELSIMRTAFHNARKRTPPKVNTVPYFPMVKETTVRQGFLTDQQYTALRDALPPELRSIFVCGYVSGIRKNELTVIQWPQVDFDENLITLEMNLTKTDDPRSVPILKGDMRNLLRADWLEHRERWPESPWVFNRQGERIIDFRYSWKKACIAAGVPDLQFHDMRRTAVRNMRRAGVPQVVRMKISGHKTDSMERRYNIVDVEDLSDAKKKMEERMNAPVTTEQLHARFGS
jgi:integrase